MDKAIRIAEETGIAVHIYHIKVRGKNNFGKIKEVIKKIDAARARVDITANQYPYTASAASLDPSVPDLGAGDAA